MTTPNIDPLIKSVRHFGAEVARLVRQLVADVKAHLRGADLETVVERVLIAVVTAAGRAFWAWRLQRALYRMTAQ